MTNIGYDYILSKIREKEVFIPKGLTTEQLAYWFNGYQACMSSIVKIITELKNDNERS